MEAVRRKVFKSFCLMSIGFEVDTTLHGGGVGEGVLPTDMRVLSEVMQNSGAEMSVLSRSDSSDVK